MRRQLALAALAISSMIVLAFVLGGSRSLVAELAGGAVLRGFDWAMLAALPLAAAVLATVVARTAVRRALQAAL